MKEKRKICFSEAGLRNWVESTEHHGGAPVTRLGARNSRGKKVHYCVKGINIPPTPLSQLKVDLPS